MLNGKIRHKKVSPENRSPLIKGSLEERVFVYELSTYLWGGLFGFNLRSINFLGRGGGEGRMLTD